jgi:hypothetical protein
VSAARRDLGIPAASITPDFRANAGPRRDAPAVRKHVIAGGRSITTDASLP